MRKILLLVLFLPMLLNAQTINIPDANLKAKLLSASSTNTVAYGSGGYMKIDTNNDNEIQVSEAMMVDSLNIQGTPGSLINSLLGLSGFQNLKKLDISGNFTPEVILDLPELRILKCTGSGVLTISPNQIPNLEVLHCELNQLLELDLTFCSNLRELKCQYNQLNLLNVSGLANLENLDCHWNALASLNLSGLSSLTWLNCATNLLSSLDISALDNLQTLSCAGNALTTISGNPPLLHALDCSDNQLGAFNALNFPQLTFLNCNANNLSSLQVAGHTNLQILQCYENQLTSLDSNGCVGLIEIGCASNLLPNITLSGLPNLHNVFAGQNLMTEVSFSSVPSLAHLELPNNQLSSIDITPLSGLTGLNLSNNLLTSLNGLNQADNLTNILLAGNQLTSLDFSGANKLFYADCSDNQFSTLDFSQNDTLVKLRCRNNPNLSFVNIKNGVASLPSISDDWSDNPSLVYVCTDEEEIETVQQILANGGLTNVNLNSYCNFTPGGDYNTISGLMMFDSASDGCDPGETAYNYIKLNIDDGTTVSSAFSNAAGSYSFYTQAGDFTISPQMEHPEWFVVSPVSQTASFEEVDNSISVHDFCISPNGTHPDLEIVVAPLVAPNPGFEAVYQIVYRNKGNQTLSQQYGVTFFYDENKQDLTMALPGTETTGPGALSWSFSNLRPFESRSIVVILNINASTDEVPVNLDDVLTYTATILPMAGDESTTDNLFVLNQTVVSSFDPNDIVCLQGDMLPPSEIGAYMHYIVNFENTGTAAAQKIVIKIEVDESMYDLSSLQLMYGSHTVNALIKGNVAEFIFDNIQLDSGGHGNILLKIRSAGNLSIGDSVLKHASIYFDYNFPVITNGASTLFDVLSTAAPSDGVGIKLYPNPVSDYLYFGSTSIESVDMYDVNGRQLLHQSGGVSRLDMSSYAAGVYFVAVKAAGASKVQKIVKK